MYAANVHLSALLKERISISSNKTDSYDITEILLKVALDTQTLTLALKFYFFEGIFETIVL
jgi:hypothetical protein